MSNYQDKHKRKLHKLPALDFRSLLWIQSHKSKPVDISTIKIAVFSTSLSFTSNSFQWVSHSNLLRRTSIVLVEPTFVSLSLSAFSWTGPTALPLVPMVFYRMFRCKILSCWKHALPSPQMTTYRPFWIWFRFSTKKQQLSQLKEWTYVIRAKLVPRLWNHCFV